MSNLQPDLRTLLDVLTALEGNGFKASFRLLETGQVSCGVCSGEFAPELAEVASLERLEGVSDPDDMLVVVAANCPLCSAAGTLTLSYGPGADELESAALLALEPVRRESSSIAADTESDTSDRLA